MSTFEHYIQSGGKRLRCGYTTGTCAALATAGAVRWLLSGTPPQTVSLLTPKQILVEVPVQLNERTETVASCTVVKDAGDDIDVTAGIHITATVKQSTNTNILITGGYGVGTVTKPGLDQPVGEAAINRVPREMIGKIVRELCTEYGYKGGFIITISAEGGEVLAKKTFNPNLGIEGGISILGTSGIVEPMSVQALLDTIMLQMRQAAAQGQTHIILTPGNYGYDFLKQYGLQTAKCPIIKCSNFIGDALDTAASLQFTQVLLVGHIGKMVKLAGGIMNTHSRYGDCRTELFCAHAAICGASRDLCQQLMGAATTDGCIALLQHAGLWQPVRQSLINAVDQHLKHRVDGRYTIGAMLFSNQYGLIGETSDAKEMLVQWQ